VESKSAIKPKRMTKAICDKRKS